jgi:hypothetical protein
MLERGRYAETTSRAAPVSDSEPGARVPVLSESKGKFVAAFRSAETGETIL